MHTRIKELLELALANSASDVHLSASMWPKIRVHGVLSDVTGFENVTPAQMSELIFSMISEAQKNQLLAQREFDFSLEIEAARFRVNMYFSKGEVAAAMRLVTNKIPDLGELNLPEICASIIEGKQGFVLVTGPTGHGKSTSVASMLSKINERETYHIVTIEDPIEYIIEPKKSIITQREVHSDTLGFNEALRSCLRQDPNVVYVGEMRDLETISSALTVAETGHLVFSTLHTNSAAQTIDRIIDVFPEGAKSQIRMQLSAVISAVISQRLVPAVNGGRLPAVEVMVATPAIKNAIREGKTYMIDNIIQTSSDVGMIGLEMSLAKLVKQGKITEEVGMAYALRPSELQSRLRNIKTSI